MISYACYVRAERNPYARYVAGGFQVIDRYALQNPSDQELFNGAMNGMIDVLRQYDDAHSQFVPAAKRSDLEEDILQEFAGVGIPVRMIGDPPLPTVLGPPEPDSPAHVAGVRSGDRIVAVDGRPTAGLEIEEVTELIRGPVGEKVALSLEREGEERPIDTVIERAVVTVTSLRGDLRDAQGRWSFRLPENPRIGYLRIVKFGDKTAAEVEAALAQLSEEGFDGLIVDLRDNGGGVMDAAVEICDLFLKAGLPIVSTRDREQRERGRFVSTGRGDYLEVPIVVIIDRLSASASEIVAACLQDWNRADVVGERSYGKGTVQTIMRLESGRSELRITSATYWRPSGENIHRMPGDGESAAWGVLPTEGLECSQDNDAFQLRRKWRLMRDIVGEESTDPLALTLAKEMGEVPIGFVDEALDVAVSHLSAQSR
ncbi:MAG: S41 family peptidase [Planctomycetota bacterium]